MKKTKSIKAGIVALLMLVCSALSVSGQAFGNSRVTLMMSPMSQRIVLIPGQTYQGGFKVANSVNAEEDLHYTTSIAPFFLRQKEDGQYDYSEVDNVTKTNMNMIMDWTTIDNPTGVISPNGSNVVSFTIDVPADAPAGGQYMEILAREDMSWRSEEIGVTEVVQMGHIIYAEVAGETRKEGVVLENNIPSFLLNSNLEATSRIRNNGNVHTDAKVVLQVWPLFSDEEICTNEEEAGTVFVMPGTERLHSEKCDLPAIGIFRAKQTVTIFGETSEVEKMVIVCPLWMIFIIIFVVILVVMWLITKSRKRKQQEDL